MEEIIKSIMKELLKLNIDEKEILLDQVKETSYKVEKIGTRYTITFHQQDNKQEETKHIRMDTYPNSDEMYAFELSLANHQLKTLHISKHSDKEEQDFAIEEIVLHKQLLSYDMGLFKTKKYLPVGSVVTLQKGVRKLMIYGRRIRNEQEHISYDYAGCFYPEGIRDFHRIILFDASQINKVHWLGLEDMEDEQVLSLMD